MIYLIDIEIVCRYDPLNSPSELKLRADRNLRKNAVVSLLNANWGGIVFLSGTRRFGAGSRFFWQPL